MRRILPPLLLLLGSLGLTASLTAQTSPVPVFNWTTLAGRASVGHDDGPAADARFHQPHGLARDTAGNLYVADELNHTVRKVTPAGVVSTFAGTAGQRGATDGTGAAARFDTPKGLAIDGSGNLYVADSGNFTVRKITPAGVVTTLAGQAGTSAQADGPAASASFKVLDSIGADTTGTVYVFDQDRIRKISLGIVSTFYSGGTVTDGGQTYTATLRDGLAVTPAGTVYGIAQITPWSGPGWCILKLDPAGAATFHLPPPTFGAPNSSNPVDLIAGLSSDGDEGFYFSASQQVYYGHESMLAHWSTAGLTWLRAIGDRHNLEVSALGISRGDNGAVLYTLEEDNSVRLLGSLSAYAGTAPARAPVNGSGAVTRFTHLVDIAVDGSGNIWGGDDSYRRVTDDIWGAAYLRKTAPDGTTTSVYSTGELDPPGAAVSVAADASGNAYFGAYVYYQVFRRVSPDGTTLALPDMTPAANYFTSNSAASPTGTLAVTGYRGVVYQWTATGQWSVLAGVHPNTDTGPVVRKDGTGGDAVIGLPVAITADRQGNFYILDADNTDAALPTTCVIRKITSAGVVTTVSRDLVFKSPASSTAPGIAPLALAIDSTGQFYVLYPDHTVRLVTASGDPAIVGGSAWSEGHDDGRGTAARFGHPLAIAIDAQDNLYVSDGDGAALRKGQNLGIGPVITGQPMGGSFAAGSAVSLSVTATGKPSPTYQWYRDGVAVANATNATLNLPTLSTTNTGAYTVVVSNAAGSVTSDPANVSLRTTTPPPSGGGGGGGAPSLWFLSLLAAAAALRARQRRTE